MSPAAQRFLGATAQRTCLPTGASGFAIVIVSAATRRAVRHHQVREALTPTYWVVFSSDTTGFLHPHISLASTITHCINAYKGATHEGEVQVFFCD